MCVCTWWGQWNKSCLRVVVRRMWRRSLFKAGSQKSGYRGVCCHSCFFFYFICLLHSFKDVKKCDEHYLQKVSVAWKACVSQNVLSALCSGVCICAGLQRLNLPAPTGFPYSVCQTTACVVREKEKSLHPLWGGCVIPAHNGFHI